MQTEAQKRVARWALLPLLALAGWGLYEVLGSDREVVGGDRQAAGGDRQVVSGQRMLPAGERGLQFAWPVPSDVEVTERDVGGPHVDVVYKYRVELRDTGEGRLTVRKRDIRVTEKDGLQVEGVDAQDITKIRATLEVGKMSPDLFIKPDGDLLDLEPWSSFSGRVEEKMNELVDAGLISPQHRETVGAELDAPAFQDQVQKAAFDFWTLWVNGWLGYDFNEQPEIEVPGVFVLPDGEIDAPQTLRHEGEELAEPGFVRLSARRRVSGDRVTEAVRSTYSDPKIRQSITAVEVVTASWVVLRPDTMQPIEAQSETRQIYTTSSLRMAPRVRGQQYWLVWK